MNQDVPSKSLYTGPTQARDSGAVSVPTPAFQKQAFDYVTKWCKASAEYVRGKIPKWKLLEDLYHNRRDLGSWTTTQAPTDAENRVGLKGSFGTRKERWQSDIILAPSYIVDSWADRAYQAIFSGPDWISVVPELPDGELQDDFQYPASFKLQELLLSRLGQGQIHVRLYEIIQHLVLFGSVYAKVFWYSKDIPRRQWNRGSLEAQQEDDLVYDCPIVQVIPLDRLLVDWTATHCDVQRHTGIGHRVDKTYEHVIEQFERGVYNLNRKQFEERWKDAPLAAGSQEESLLEDPDAESPDQDVIRRLTVWEWHGRVPTAHGHKELLCAIVTECGAETPENGVMVRLTDSPALWCGLRPFLAAHYTPTRAPFGVGVIESNLDLIHGISQFISQSQDNARLTANAQLIVRRGSSAARQISAEHNVVHPGKVWVVDDPTDIMPFPNLNFPQNDINMLINYLNSILEKRTTVSDVTLGVAGRSKSATEAHILNESAMAPFSTRTDLFTRSFVEPLGRLALSMLQQFMLEDQYIMVKDFSGVEAPVVVTAAEIQGGRYRVVATLTRQESTRLAKAQSIERALPTLSNFQPILAQEGVQISFSELLKRYLDLIGVDGADRIINRVEPTPGVGPVPPYPSPGPAAPPYPGPPLGPDAGEPPPNGPARLVENGGPMGPQPTDANAMAQLLQNQASQSTPRVGGPIGIP